jgi:hypothetical protein
MLDSVAMGNGFVSTGSIHDDARDPLEVEWTRA